jgi:hypothetical protein
MTETPSPFDAVCSGYSLQRAWMEVRAGRTVARRQHGAGVDGVTIAQWECPAGRPGAGHVPAQPALALGYPPP